MQKNVKDLKLDLHIESLIFSSEDAISLREIGKVLEATFQQKFDKKDTLEAIDRIKAKYSHEDFAIEIVEISGGYQFLSKGTYFNTIGQYLKINSRKKLSKAALETLAIVAYKQPVTKTELEKIRGVSCDYSVQKLLEKELVELLGRADSPGRPILYGTSQKFMNYFGLKNLKELPQLKDIRQKENEIGDTFEKEMNDESE